MEFRFWTRLAAHSRKRGEGGLGFQRYDTTAGRGSASIFWFWVLQGRRQLSARLERRTGHVQRDCVSGNRRWPGTPVSR